VTDVAVSSVVAPAAVTQGSTAAVAVTVQNVGGLNVSGNFVWSDGLDAALPWNTKTVAGLGVGATATRTFNWNTTGAAGGRSPTRRNPQPERRERGQQPERSDIP